MDILTLTGSVQFSCQAIVANYLTLCSQVPCLWHPGQKSLLKKKNKLKIGNSLQQLMDWQISVQPYSGQLLYKRKKKVTNVHSIKINLKRIYWMKEVIQKTIIRFYLHEIPEKKIYS